jgi:hypothetical protein
MKMVYPGESSSASKEEASQRETEAVLGRWSGGRGSKARV